MSTEFDTFCESPLGALIESPVGARDCPEPPDEPRRSGCCCYDIMVPVVSPPFCFPGDWPGDPLQFTRVKRCQTVSESWFAWAQAFIRENNPTAPPDWEITRDFCIFAVADCGTIDFQDLTWPVTNAGEYHSWLQFAHPECHERLFFSHPNLSSCMSRFFTSWRDDCRCLPLSTSPGDPIPNAEEQCGHVAGYCCLLIDGRWTLSPEGDNTWEQYCTEEVQQQYFRDEIRDVHFEQAPDDPDDPCPEDPITTGWCCITLLDGRVFSSVKGENEEFEDCTVEAQQPNFPFTPILEVNWLGPVGGGCDPCGVPQGTCCVRSSSMFPGLCIRGLTDSECVIDLRVEGLQPNVWTGIGDGVQCQPCVDPLPPPDPSSWLGPRGRCCSSFEFFDGANWSDRVTDCRHVTVEDCGTYRQSLVDDRDRYRAFLFDFWQAGWDCDTEPGDGTIDERGCRSDQGWCCSEGATGNGAWTTRNECEVGRNGTLYPPETNPDRLCALVRPCCRPRYQVDFLPAAGVVVCDMQRPEECERLAGQSMGSQGDDCNDVECQTGACCLGCSRCSDNTPPAECEKLNGEYRGHSTQCGDIDDCPEGPL